MEPIKIFKGNDTNFNEGKFLTFVVTSDIDLSDFVGEFSLGRFVKPGGLADGKMDVVIPAEVTRQFPLGLMCGTFKIYDTKMRVATVANSIPFLVTDQVFTPTDETVSLNTPEGYPVEISMQVGFSGGNYNDLNNLPQIDGVTLNGNKTAAELGLATPTDLQPITQDVAQLQSDVAGKQAALSAEQLNAANSGIDSQKVGQIAQNAQDIDSVKAVIPSQASVSNQLADKGFVNSTVQTSTAHFRGNWETFADVPTDPSLYPADEFGVHEPGPNDYMVVRVDETQDGGTWRYKYTGSWATGGKNGWEVEYPINGTTLTAAQLAALNSGVTNTKVAGYDTHVANTMIHVTQEQKALWNAKQDALVAGKYISITPVEKPIIDEHTLGLWHLNGDATNAVSGSMLNIEGAGTFVNSNPHFGTASVANSDLSISSSVTTAFTQFTVDWWGLLSSPNPNGRIYFCFGNPINLPSAEYYFSASKIWFGSEIAMEPETWHHFAFTFNKGPIGFDVVLFVDGKKYDNNVTALNGYNSLNLSNRDQRPCVAGGEFQSANSGVAYALVEELRFSDIVRWTDDFTPFDEPYSNAEEPTQYAVNNLIDPSSFVSASQKGVAAGVATLDNTGQITNGQIPYATETKVGGIKSSFDSSTGTWTVTTEDL